MFSWCSRNTRKKERTFSKEETFELLREERDQKERGLEAEAYGKEGMLGARAQVT